MTSPESPTKRHPNRPSANFIGLTLIFILFGMVQQMRSVSFAKVIDDNDLVDSVSQRGCGPNPVDCFRHPVFELYYRPLFTATFSVGDTLHARAADAVNAFRNHFPRVFDRQYPLQPHDAIWYHLENLALHAAVCVLAFWFFYLLFKRERPALLAGLIFTLHPLQVTVTTWIGGRPDSMALFFLLLFSIGAMNSVQDAASSRSALRRFAWRLLSVLAYACAVFTKEQCVFLLLLLPLLLLRPGQTLFPKNQSSAPTGESLFEKLSLRTLLGRHLPWIMLYLTPVVVYINAARHIIPFAVIPTNQQSSVTLHLGWSVALRLEMIARTLWYFQRLLVLPAIGPIHQSTLGPWDVPQPGTVLLGVLLTLLWLAMLWRVRHNPALRFCALWTTVTLLPCINLIPIPSQFASCYRAVIPLLGFAGLLGAALDKLYEWQERTLRLRRNEIALAVVFGIGVYYSWETCADVSSWQNLRTLMQAEIYGDPNFLPAYGGLGIADDIQEDWKRSERDYDAILTPILPKIQPGQTFAGSCR